MPGGYKNINGQDGTLYSSQYQPANRGRKPRVFKQIASEFNSAGYERATESVVAEAYEYLLALPLSEVLAIASNPKTENGMPALYRLAAKEMLGRRSQEIVREMLDRAHGKTKQKNEVSGLDGGPIKLETHGEVSPELLESLIKTIKTAG